MLTATESSVTKDIGGSKGAPGMPPGVEILSFSCSFWQKNLQKNPDLGNWRTPSGNSDPPLREAVYKRNNFNFTCCLFKNNKPVHVAFLSN